VPQTRDREEKVVVEQVGEGERKHEGSSPRESFVTTFLLVDRICVHCQSAKKPRCPTATTFSVRRSDLRSSSICEKTEISNSSVRSKCLIER
jgi:hypothetical protein